MAGHIDELIKGKKYRVWVEAGKKTSNKTGRKRLKRIFYGSASGARLFQSQLETDIARGTYVDPSKLTFGEYLLRWYDGYVKTLEATTQRRYKQIINLRVVPLLGGIPLEKLRTVHIKDFYAQIIKDGQIVRPKKKKKDDEKEQPTWKPLSKASLKYHHAVIHKSLNDAVEDELIQHNPAPKSPPRPLQDPDDDDDDIREKVKVLTPGQVVLSPIK
jgi:integrase